MKFEVTFEVSKDDQIIVLTTEEAQELYNRLKQHFGNDPPVNPIPIIYPQGPQPPYTPMPNTPYVPWTEPSTDTPPGPPPWTITCTYGDTYGESSVTN